MLLHRYLTDREDIAPVAVQEASSASVSYPELSALASRCRDRLRHLGVTVGDRVGLCLPKSIDTVAAIFGTLRCGAAYVPVDSTAPASRNAYILADCDVRALIVDEVRADDLTRALADRGKAPAMLRLGRTGSGAGLDSWLEQAQNTDPAPVAETAAPSPNRLAYILYTSGSTGKPKGVMLSHENAVAFVEWCASVFEPRSDDVFSSHAPFHFDLSILDLYLPIKAGATLTLIPEQTGKEPAALAELIARAGITIWYSAPSILSMLAQFGNLAAHDYSKLRHVLFAGEVFPVAHLRSLKGQWPGPRYFNLYGPTETNVCTFHEIPSEIPPDRSAPYPIGQVCSQLQSRVIDLDGGPVQPGQEGELCIAGPNVMQGYWNLPERTASAFIEQTSGARFYKTGDIVIDTGDGVLTFVGRRDRMVKKRGFRVELGEIEAALYRHEAIQEVAVVAIPNDEVGLTIRAHLATKGGDRISVIRLKKFCSEHLPTYMIPDVFSFHDALPKTSTDKIDYQTLKREA